MSDRLPAPRASRPSVGVRARTAAGQLAPEELARAKRVVLSETDAASIESVIAALPDPDELDGGTLVIVPAEMAGASSFARSVLAVFGRAKTVARTRRCSALVARGYVDVGACGSENGGEDGDLAWGRVPTEPC